MNIDYAALTDLYQITMAQGYFDHGMGDTEACFHMYFRNYPFKGGYAIACGMDQLAELVETYGFTDEDIEYLAALPAPGGGKLFHDDFLNYLSGFKLSVDIDAVVLGPFHRLGVPERAACACVRPYPRVPAHRNPASELR